MERRVVHGPPPRHHHLRGDGVLRVSQVRRPGRGGDHAQSTAGKPVSATFYDFNVTKSFILFSPSLQPVSGRADPVRGRHLLLLRAAVLRPHGGGQQVDEAQVRQQGGRLQRGRVQREDRHQRAHV